MITKNITMGIFAHVDSGKTTLEEAILYKSGSIRKFGRVDYQNSFLDTNEMEKSRGITIFSKQANVNIGEYKITILDTPGHIDFSIEMERTIQVIDYAILVISASDGIQGHTQTLWKLLKYYNIPVFIFINKMDQPGIEKDKIKKDILSMIDDCCIDFNNEKKDYCNFLEEISLCNEELMNKYIGGEKILINDISYAIKKREVFPCFYGSALKLDGIDELIDGINKYIMPVENSDNFSARIYKICRDDKKNRLTYLKITGGMLKVKDKIKYTSKTGLENSEKIEKVDQIRIYSGNQYITTNEVCAGTVCAVTGLSDTFIGQGIGSEIKPVIPLLESVITYKVLFSNENNIYDIYTKLKELEEEEPELNIIWDKVHNEINVCVMGEVQLEILKSLIFNRFNIAVTFSEGSIVYKETIDDKVIGIGHFEPLRHYAEVLLLIEPLERGSGIEFDSVCSEDILDKNIQKIILSHLEEKKHKGVLIGAEITDIKITVINGRYSLKHTEGGDFRQATYRAVRHGLKSAKSILLEPIYKFRIEVPQENIGRTMYDMQQRYGKFDLPEINNNIAILSGTVPVATIKGYQKELISYTKGFGKISCSFNGYEKCHNEEQVIDEIKYNSEEDIENPTGSIFCAHGVGYYVNWDEVQQYAHVKSEYINNIEVDEKFLTRKRKVVCDDYISQEEIEEIFNKTYGEIKKKRVNWKKKVISFDEKDYFNKDNTHIVNRKEEYLLIDGYNIIFAWKELRELAEINIDSARDKLMDIMCNYQGYRNIELIIVFDAYKVHGGNRKIFDYNNIHIVYTKEAETADQYIEKFAHETGKKYKVVVATSDRLEQMIIWGDGATRVSAKGLFDEVKEIEKEIAENINRKIQSKEKNYTLNNLMESIKQNINNDES